MEGEMVAVMYEDEDGSSKYYDARVLRAERVEHGTGKEGQGEGNAADGEEGLLSGCSSF